MKIKISAISYYLPEAVEGLEVLACDNPTWDMPKLFAKTGIRNRHIASLGQTASDLAFEAASNLLRKLPDGHAINLLIFVTQSPDYLLPTSACILQDRLGLPESCMAFDINLGCSGFVTALSVAGSLIESGVAQKGLILCADTYSKYIAKTDRTCRPIFSDGAAAILVDSCANSSVGPFEFGTDGSGFDRLIVRNGGAREPNTITNFGANILEMHGSDIFLFTMRVVPEYVSKLLDRAKLSIDEVNLFIFHQASKLVIENLTRTLSLNPEKVFENYEYIGNTVSATIPIALKDAETQGRLKDGDTVMLIGFGVGLSWAATLVRWSIPS